MEGLPGGTTLKGRTNIVLTHQKDYTFGDAIIVHSKEEALERLKEYNDEDIFIIGGEKVYRDFLPYCKKAYVTKVDYRYDADVFFPNLDEDDDWVMRRITIWNIILRSIKERIHFLTIVCSS